MQCIKPIQIKNPASLTGENLTVPCGKCIACRIAKRKEWSLRMYHELNYHNESVFLTLTYDDLHLPDNNSLVKKDLQKFFKRLRRDLKGRKIKYFACGEYGDKTNRPHYHAIVFGLGLGSSDKLLVMENWPFADWSVKTIRDKSFGIAEADSIRYVAQYIDKKFTGDLADEEYSRKGREAVFRILSHGIGFNYANDNLQQITENGYITYHGVKHSIPRYYIKKFELDTNLLKDKAIIAQSELIEHLTGVNISEDDLFKTMNPDLIEDYYKGLLGIQKQSERNLLAKVNLKSSKL